MPAWSSDVSARRPNIAPHATSFKTVSYAKRISSTSDATAMTIPATS